ncbi:TPA: hypothetical protein ACWSTX_002534 [Escherichia coli]|jgi:hypothetical protein|uniref:hypothetical protein n=1 Tax=Klebsiella pneumoniae complex TaxID=3390273 RepID=UPI00097CCE1E|nr:MULTISPECIES: hypothetical protein [Klebsiella]EAZ2778166.1 hypothetical protein [Salmonella enterica]EEC3190068.1 hypothetical protein [Salmonella enterica subsp. enterica serovar Kentucky]EEW2196227.1 hypothetical protein [Escherichia coli]HBX3550169.1 hypothetical protein [Klebsiella pneumoniae subsp. pneumoniae]HDT4324679.1 hypothetical protein [Klebsiella aerogenes]
MNMRGILFVLPLCAGLLAGCDNKQEALQFEAARTAALKADDPFLALDSFEQQSGDYGRDCDSLGAFLFGNFASTDKACRARDEATRDMVLKAVEKGSVPALVFLFDPGSKTPDVYPRDIDPQKAGQAAERLVALAESAPVDSKNQALLMRAGDVLQAGQYVLQDSRRAAALYVKAWQAGDQRAADELVRVYHFLKDSRRTYFWEVRSKNVQQLDSRAELTGDEISAIQKLAADSSRTDI